MGSVQHMSSPLIPRVQPFGTTTSAQMSALANRAGCLIPPGEGVVGRPADHPPEVYEALARHHLWWAIDSTHVCWLDRPERSSGLFDIAKVEGAR